MRITTVRFVAAFATVVAAAAGGAASAVAGSLAEVRTRGVLDVAVYKDFPPFAYRRDGKTVGIDVDVARALAERLDVSAALRFVGADENMSDDLRNNVWKGHYIGGGVADVMLHVPMDPAYAAREDMVRFVGAYYREALVLAADRDHVPADASVDVFKRVKVGVELDTLADFHLLGTLGGILAPNVVHYTNLTDAGAGMRAGEVAAIFGPSSEVEATFAGGRSFPVQTLSVPGRSRMQWDLGAAVRFNHEALGRAVDDAMSAMREDGTLEKLFAAHGISWRAPSDVAVGMGSR